MTYKTGQIWSFIHLPDEKLKLNNKKEIITSDNIHNSLLHSFLLIASSQKKVYGFQITSNKNFIKNVNSKLIITINWKELNIIPSYARMDILYMIPKKSLAIPRLKELIIETDSIKINECKNFIERLLFSDYLKNFPFHSQKIKQVLKNEILKINNFNLTEKYKITY